VAKKPAQRGRRRPPSSVKHPPGTAAAAKAASVSAAALAELGEAPPLTAAAPPIRRSKEDPFALEEEYAPEKKAKGVLAQVRRIIKYFNSSTQALKELRDIYDKKWDQEGLPAGFDPEKEKRIAADDWSLTQDVVTRWWSTYKMLERLFRPHVIESIGIYYLNNREFKKLETATKKG